MVMLPSGSTIFRCSVLTCTSSGSDGIRTRTVMDLNHVPLPVGPRSRLLSEEVEPGAFQLAFHVHPDGVTTEEADVGHVGLDRLFCREDLAAGHQHLVVASTVVVEEQLRGEGHVGDEKRHGLLVRPDDDLTVVVDADGVDGDELTAGDVDPAPGEHVELAA
jgi:hypothetical protein